MLKKGSHIAILGPMFDPLAFHAEFIACYRELACILTGKDAKIVLGQFIIADWINRHSPTAEQQLSLVSAILESCKAFKDDNDTLLVHSTLLSSMLQAVSLVKHEKILDLILKGVLDEVYPSLLVG
jgi:hypothetical protein